MKFYIDTANVDEIRRANDMGIIAGVTTNPSLIAKEGRDYAETLKEITTIVDGPISGEVKATTKGSEFVRKSESQKSRPSSDCGLQPAHMKSELLVIADQHAAVNTFPGLVHTARHTTRVVCTRSRRPNPKGAEASKVWRVRGVKS